MDWNSEGRRKMLERIVALLLSLAVLADRAARLPTLLRLPLLAVLGYGECVARDFVMDLVWETGATINADAAESLTAGDAEQLAARLRMLAMVLNALLAATRHPARGLVHAAGPPAASSTTRRYRAFAIHRLRAMLPGPDPPALHWPSRSVPTTVGSVTRPSSGRA